LPFPYKAYLAIDAITSALYMVYLIKCTSNTVSNVFCSLSSLKRPFAVSGGAGDTAGVDNGEEIGAAMG
jgi:hypothetical protein